MHRPILFHAMLVVEDDPMIGRAARRRPAERGPCRGRGSRRRRAELALLHGPYDLAVLDLGLPRKDGFDVLKSCGTRVSMAGADHYGA